MLGPESQQQGVTSRYATRHSMVALFVYTAQGKGELFFKFAHQLQSSVAALYLILHVQKHVGTGGANSHLFARL